MAAWVAKLVLLLRPQANPLKPDGLPQPPSTELISRGGPYSHDALAEHDPGYQVIGYLAQQQYLDAVKNGAIAGIWIVSTQQIADEEKNHWDRDGKCFVVRENWALKNRLITTGDGYLESLDLPGETEHCRCHIQYVFSPRRLPPSVLTHKGQKWVSRTPPSAAHPSR